MNSHKHTESDSNHSSKLSGGVPTILSLSLSFTGLTPYAFHSLYLLTQIYHVLSPVRPYLPLSITKCSLSHHPFCHSLLVPSLCSDIWVLSYLPSLKSHTGPYAAQERSSWRARAVACPLSLPTVTTGSFMVLQENGNHCNRITAVSETFEVVAPGKNLGGCWVTAYTFILLNRDVYTW